VTPDHLQQEISEYPRPGFEEKLARPVRDQQHGHGSKDEGRPEGDAPAQHPPGADGVGHAFFPAANAPAIPHNDDHANNVQNPKDSPDYHTHEQGEKCAGQSDQSPHGGEVLDVPQPQGLLI
jgi:hypothetical protein